VNRRGCGKAAAIRTDSGTLQCNEAPKLSLLIIKITNIKAMLKSSFSKLPQHKKFSYTPRYYNPEKEELDKKKDLKLERGSFYKNRNSLIAGSLSSNKDRAFRRNTSKRNQFFRTVLLFIMLGILTLYLLGMVSGIFTFAFLLIFLLLFISKANTI